MMPWNMAPSPLRDQAPNTLRRARKLPPGPNRNDLRQLGVGLLKLYKNGLRGKVQMASSPRYASEESDQFGGVHG
jgi:hypothetical protein